MQYHVNGYRPGSPHVALPHENTQTNGLPQSADVVIIGCGPAGLTLAAQLAAFPQIKTVIVDQKTGPLTFGQADGIACRSVEMFEAFGFAERVLREAYWVNETTFWKPDPEHSAGITRSDRIQDTEDGLSEFPHVILSQARVHDFYLDVMRNSASRLKPYYDRKFQTLSIDPTRDHPITVTLEDDAKIETIQARYVVGCDGARSGVRKALGLQLEGDAANQAWGVMDVLVDTSFPDIRLKSVVHSANEGSVLIIPREGGYLVRLYVEMDKLNQNERVAAKNITQDHLIKAAQRILNPYRFDVKEVAWWSVYEIGQRLCDRFDNAAGSNQIPCVFIAGDAAHTHSPKAGQGMNVSMADAFNLGWKLASVLTSKAAPTLLQTYSIERQSIAQELIYFDRAFAKMFSTKQSQDAGTSTDPKAFQRYFQQHGRFTAGTSVTYAPSFICSTPQHQELAQGFQIGTRFHSAPVIRVADAKPMQLGHVLKADGRWRLIAFNGEDDRIDQLCDFLRTAPSSPLLKFTHPEMDRDSVIDLRTVYQQGHRDIDISLLPELLLPQKGQLGLTDYEKVFSPDLNRDADIFDIRGINRKEGCLVIVRPDQFVAQVLPLTAYDALADFFDRFMLPV